MQQQEERRHNHEKRHAIRHAMDALTNSETRVFRTYMRFYDVLYVYHNGPTPVSVEASMLTAANEMQKLRNVTAEDHD